MPYLGPAHSLASPIYEAHGLPLAGQRVTDTDDWQYRRMGRSATAIPEYKRTQSVFVSRYLFQFNPMAHRLVETLVNFVVGNTSFEVHADDPDVQKFIDEFWTHRHNRWDLDWIARYCLSLSVDGELSLPVQVTKGDPIPLIGYISSLLIKDARPLPFRPGTASDLVITPERIGEPDLVLPVLGRQSIEEIEAMGDQGIIGAFYTSINAMADHPRGSPDLFVLADDLDQWNKTNWARMRKQEQEGAYIWDVTIDGATKQMLDLFEKELILNPPRSGGYRVHNDRVKWDTVESAGNGTDASNELRYHRANIASTFGLPDFFLSGESGSGRMATSELWSTVIATAGSRQREMKIFVRDVVNFALDWAILNSRLKPNVDRKFRVTAPVIGIRDLQRMAGMLTNFQETILTLYENNVLSDDNAKGILRTILINLGFELKPDDDLERIPTAEDRMAQSLKQAKDMAKLAPKTPEPTNQEQTPPANTGGSTNGKSSRKVGTKAK